MFEVIVETFHNDGEQSSNPGRVRPVAGQFKQDFRIWCSIANRRVHPVGALFRVVVSKVEPVAMAPYLRISPDEEWHLVTATQARKFLSGAPGRRKRKATVR